MSGVHTSIEDETKTKLDPYNWSVEEVVNALCDPNSRLRRTYGLQTFPDERSLAASLREHDVTGRALLQKVDADCLERKFGIKSMGQQDCLEEIIEILQLESTKYRERQIRRSSSHAARSSNGRRARIETAYLPTLSEGGAPPSEFGPWRSDEATFKGCSKVSPTAEQGIADRVPQNAPLGCTTGEASPLLQPHYSTGQALVAAENSITIVDVDNDLRSCSAAEGDQVVSTTDGDLTNNIVGKRLAVERNLNVDYVQTTIIDDSGRKRRRLAPTLVTESSSAHPVTEASSDADFHDPMPVAGVVQITENGRKRVKPILLDPTSIRHGGDIDDSFHARPPLIEEPAQCESTDTSGLVRRPQRSVDQIYLGLDSFGVDKLFYSHAQLQQSLHDSTSSSAYKLEVLQDLDEFHFMSSNSHSAAQKQYVHSRMKHYLQRPSLSLGSGPEQRFGIVPYPSRIAGKFQLLSMTIFERDLERKIIAKRADRTKWVEKFSVLNLAPQDQINGANHVEFADLNFAFDDDNDGEWKSLEKWRYMVNDTTLPAYGDSSSEGEYDPATWKEMEYEAQEMEKVGVSPKKQMMSHEEVHEAIDMAVEGIVEDWRIRKQPRLQQRAWRIWIKAKRDRTSKAQVQSIDEAIAGLKSRLEKLRNEIAKETWSNSTKVVKQCSILQPSVYDLETMKWERGVLQLSKRPKRLSSSQKKSSPLQFEAAENSRPAEGDEETVTDADESACAEDSLDEFIVDQDEETSNKIQDLILDNESIKADIEDEDGDVDILQHFRDTSHGLTAAPIPQQDLPYKEPQHVSPTRFAVQPDFVDLTQASSDSEAVPFFTKAEMRPGVKTPPINSGSDSDPVSLWNQRVEPVFKPPRVLPQSQDIVIELDSSSTEDGIDPPTSTIPVQRPSYSNIEAIKQINPNELIEQQDRKRLLIWIIAHTPVLQRDVVLQYLEDLSMETVQESVMKALKAFLAHRHRVPGLESECSDSMMQVAAWFVSWTVVIKYSATGLDEEHLKTTLQEGENFETFYDFLLVCMKSYERISTPPTPPTSATPQKSKKEKIIREDVDGNWEDSPFRKRVYAVHISEETLAKTHSALERQKADERRRKAELRSRIAQMKAGETDVTEVPVNPGKLEDQQLISLDPQFGRGARLKPHQEEGLQFLWREITADHDDLQGCLLAQTMGLGKTIQVIALLVTLSQAGRSLDKNVCQQVPHSLRESRTLVLCPPALVENWWDEFLLWVPNLEDNIGRLHKISAAMKLEDRILEILTWDEHGGVLIMGYVAFRNLILNKGKKAKGGQLIPPPIEETVHRSVVNALLEHPRLVVADEAHEFKNAQSGLSLVMNRIKTRSRVALTGSPLANNLGEYYSLIDWVAPKYLGNPAEFRATYQEVIDEGLYQDSTNYQYREARKRLKALELVMGPKVHRADITALHSALYGKMEFVIKLPLTPLQDRLYRVFVDAALDTTADGEPQRALLWTWLHVLQLLCNHPKLFKEKVQSVEAELMLPSTANTTAKKKTLTNPAEDTSTTSDDDDAIITERSSHGTIGRIIGGTKAIFEKVHEPIDCESFSNKMLILMAIVEHCRSAGDKMLIFSHRIPALDYIANRLRVAGIQFDRIDGTVDPQKRQAITKSFNERSLSVCLVSTRAGGQGLNLFGANRVVILDDWFNPMWEQQAIGRAYRIGQQKPVYVYRLTTAGTFEQAIQNQSLFKEQLATRVVDKRNPVRSAKKGARQYLFIPERVSPEDLSDLQGKDPLVLDRLLAARERYDMAELFTFNSLISFSNSILSIVPSETFHIDDGVELTLEEKREVEQMQRDEELRRRDPMQYAALILQRKVGVIIDRFGSVGAPSVPHSTAPHRLSDGVIHRSQPASTLGQMTFPIPTTPTALPSEVHQNFPATDNILNDSLKPNKHDSSLQLSVITEAPNHNLPESSSKAARTSEPRDVSSGDESKVKAPQSLGSLQPLTPKTNGVAPRGQCGDATELRGELEIYLSFLTRPRSVVTHAIPALTVEFAKNELKDAIGSCKSKSMNENENAGSLSSEIYSRKIASLIQGNVNDTTEYMRAINKISSILKRDNIHVGMVFKTLIAMLNVESPEPPPHPPKKQNATAELADTSPLKDKERRGKKTLDPKEDATTVEEYNWKTPPRGKKRNLLLEDDTPELAPPQKRQKTPPSIIEAGFKSVGPMEATFANLIRRESMRNKNEML